MKHGWNTDFGFPVPCLIRVQSVAAQSVFHPWLKNLVSWGSSGRLGGERAAEDAVPVDDHDAQVLGAGLLDDGISQVANERAAGVIRRGKGDEAFAATVLG